MSTFTNRTRLIIATSILLTATVANADENWTIVHPVGERLPVLKPVHSSGLRPVPQSFTSANIRLVAHESGDQKASTVSTELQQLMREKTHQQQTERRATEQREPDQQQTLQQRFAARRRFANQRRQMREQMLAAQNTTSQNAAAQHTVPRNTGTPEPPSQGGGLLRRLFGGFSQVDGENEQDTVAQRREIDLDNPYQDSGLPTPHVPRPPALKYRTNTQTQTAARRNQAVVARPAVVAREKGSAVPYLFGKKPPTSANSHVSVSQSRVTTESPREQAVAPRQSAVPEETGFVDPFEGDLAVDDDVLDLDALLAEHQDSQQVSESDASQTISDAETSISDAQPIDPPVQDREPELLVAEDSHPAIAPDANRQLNIEDELPLQPEVNMVLPQDATEADTDDMVAADARETDDELREPVMQLPPVEVSTGIADVESNAALEKVPLLDIEPTDLRSGQTDKNTSLADSDRLNTAQPHPLASSDAAPVAANSDRAMKRRDHQEQQRFRIMKREGRGGFKGFCPVLLRDQQELIDSRETIKARFGLRTYYFSSSEAKAAFEANPARYAPAAGGSDVVLLVNTGEDAEGSLDFSLWYRDRLYMFRSRETQTIFSRDPSRFADQY